MPGTDALHPASAPNSSFCSRGILATIGIKLRSGSSSNADCVIHSFLEIYDRLSPAHQNCLASDEADRVLVPVAALQLVEDPGRKGIPVIS